MQVNFAGRVLVWLHHDSKYSSYKAEGDMATKHWGRNLLDDSKNRNTSEKMTTVSKQM